MWLASCGDGICLAGWWCCLLVLFLRQWAERAVPAGLSTEEMEMWASTSQAIISHFLRFTIHSSQSGTIRGQSWEARNGVRTNSKLGRHHPFQWEHRTFGRTGGSMRHEPVSENSVQRRGMIWNVYV